MRSITSSADRSLAFLEECRLLPRRQVTLRDRSEQRLDLGQRRVRVEASDHDERGIVRVVPVVVVPLDDLGGGVANVRFLTDHGVRIRRRGREEQLQNGLIFEVPRAVLVPL
jgi:hypothetical protein